jgi:hypothetical protein
VSLDLYNVAIVFSILADTGLDLGLEDGNLEGGESFDDTGLDFGLEDGDFGTGESFDDTGLDFGLEVGGLERGESLELSASATAFTTLSLAPEFRLTDETFFGRW